MRVTIQEIKRYVVNTGGKWLPGMRGDKIVIVFEGMKITFDNLPHITSGMYRVNVRERRGRRWELVKSHRCPSLIELEDTLADLVEY